MEQTPVFAKQNKKQIGVLLASVFFIAVCGILYELLISTLTSYFQGSSILHFSIVIGLFLSFMGVGAFLSKFLHTNLLQWFIIFEIALSIVGGFSSFLLYFSFSLTPYFYGFAFFIIALIGTFIGIEIPILTRIIGRFEAFKDAIANVLSFDYLGSLLASIIFPLLLLPYFGTMRTAFVVGLINLSVAFFNTFIFKKSLKKFQLLFVFEIVTALALLVSFIFSFQITRFFDTYLYQDEIILSKQSPYQQVVLTRWNQDIRLFINGNLQFSSRDEYRYHEPLVHLPMALATHREKILVLGGGDGLATREILQYQDVEQIEVVDLDPLITQLAQKNSIFQRLNQNAFNHPKVRIINADAYKFIEKSSELYNVIIIDLPDPNDTSLGKLYTRSFYELLQKRIANGGVIVTQSTSPYFAPNAFWCIHNTLKSVFPATLPYQTYVPSFGQWGFNLAIATPKETPSNYSQTVDNQVVTKISTTLFSHKNPFRLRFLTPNILPTLFQFDADTQHRPTEINTLENQKLLFYYEQSWNDWR